MALSVHGPQIVQPTMDRFLVLSLLEDLQFPPPPEDPLFPGDSKKGKQTRYDELFVASPTGLGNGSLPSEADGLNSSAASSPVDEGLLTAGEQTDAVDESCERQLARVRAIAHLPALARKMGARWSSAELVPYLLRCCEEDTEALSFAVAKVVPSLLGLSSVAIPKPPLSVGGGGSSGPSPLMNVGADTDNKKSGDSSGGDSARYTFAARSQRALEASLAVTEEVVAETIANTTYYADLPPAPQPSASGAPAPALVNAPSQHVVTPDVLAPVLMALSSVTSQLVRRFVADVTIPLVCFGVPFSLCYPLFPPLGGGAGATAEASFSSLGGGKTAIPLPSDGGVASAEDVAATASLGLSNSRASAASSSSHPSAPIDAFDDAFFHKLLRLTAASSDGAPLSAAASSEVSALLAEWEAARIDAERRASNSGGAACSASALLCADVDPFTHSLRRAQLHAAISGAFARQATIFGPHSHAFFHSSGGDGDGGAKSSAGSGGSGLFVTIVRQLIAGGGSATRTSILSCPNDVGVSHSGSGEPSAAWPLHAAMAVRLVANLVRATTACAVFHPKELCRVVGAARRGEKGSAGGGNTSSPSQAHSSSDASSSSPSAKKHNSLMPIASSCRPFGAFEERSLIASFLQETVSLRDTVLPALSIVAGAVLDERKGEGGGGGKASRTASGADLLSRQGAAMSAAADEVPTASSSLGNGLAVGVSDFIFDNPFIAAWMDSSAPPSPLPCARRRLRYPIPIAAIEAFAETLMPALAIGDYSRVINQLIGSVGGAVTGYCGVPKLSLLLPSLGPYSHAAAPTSATVLEAAEVHFLTGTDVSSILFDLLAMPIPTAAAALPPSAVSAGGPSAADGYGAAMGTVSLDALRERAAALSSAVNSGSGGLRGGDGGDDAEEEASRSLAEVMAAVAGAGGAAAMGLSGSVSRQPSMQPAHQRIVGSSANAAVGGVGPQREPKTMFSIVAAVRTSRSVMGQLVGGASSPLPWGGLSSSASSRHQPLTAATPLPLLRERLQLLRSRSFGGHYCRIVALCCGAYASIARLHGYLMALTVVALSAGQAALSGPRDGFEKDGANAFLSHLLPSSAGASALRPSRQTAVCLQVMREAPRHLSSLLFAASCGIAAPIGLYMDWRSRYCGAAWLPAVAAAVAGIAERLSAVATAVVPPPSPADPTLLSSSSSSSAHLLSSGSVDAEGMALLRDALILWRGPSSLTCISPIIVKASLSAADYGGLAAHVGGVAWPLLRKAQWSCIATSKALATADFEEEVRVMALQRLVVGGCGDASGSSSSSSSSDGSLSVASASASLRALPIPSVSASAFAVTAAMGPLALLFDAVSEAAAERRRHNSHRRPAGASKSDPLLSLLPAPSAVLRSQAIGAEVLSIVRAALGGGGGPIVIGDGGSVAGGPANVSERQRAIAPVGLTRLLADCWRCSAALASCFAADASAPLGLPASPLLPTSPIALFPRVGSAAFAQQRSSDYVSALASCVRPSNEEDLRFIHHALGERAVSAKASLTAEYGALREECSAALAALAQDKGPLVQAGIVNAMMLLLSSSTARDSPPTSGGGGEAASGGALVAAADGVASGGGSGAIARAPADAAQPSALDRAEVEVLVSETCGRLVRSDVWRVREAFAPTLAKAAAAYVAPAVLLGVDALGEMAARQQRYGGGSDGTSDGWSDEDALFYERVFAEVLGLSAPGDASSSSSSQRTKGAKSAAPRMSPALLVANYRFAVTELLPMLAALVFDRTKAVRDAATEAAACLALTLRQASAAFDSRVGASGRLSMNGSNTSSCSTTRPFVESFINTDLFVAGIAEAPSAAQHSYLMRVQLLSVAVTVGVDKTTVLLPLLGRLATDPIVNVRMATAKAIGALVRRQRMVEGTAAAQTQQSTAVAVAAPPPAASSSGIRRGLLLPIAANASASGSAVGGRLGGKGSAAASTSEGGSGGGNGGSASSPSEVSNSPHPSLLTVDRCFYYSFSPAEVEEVLCAAMLRPLIGDPSEDVRDVATAAFTACY